MTIKLVLTSGEPAGIGPDLVLAAAMKTWDAGLVALGDRALFASRAVELGIEVELIPYSSSDTPSPHRPGKLPFIHIPLSNPCRPGQLNPTNASYVMAQLDMAVSLCQAGECAGMVTAPVHKAVINDAGIAFSGHTEYLAATTGAEKVVMMLTAGDLRVALATTHLPLRAVPDAIDSASLTETLRVMNNALQSHFGLKTPRITVLGLNPHAGESGHLGWEEKEVISPVCDRLRAEGMNITGPIPADSAFIPAMRAESDAYLAMYHDQGLAVLKALGFREAVNVTLGLPLVRTSVDHGTALDLAASGNADASSMLHAIEAAISLSTHSTSHP